MVIGLARLSKLPPGAKLVAGGARRRDRPRHSVRESLVHHGGCRAGLHLWVEHDLGTSSSSQRRQAVVPIIFGPSISIGNIGTNL